MLDVKTYDAAEAAAADHFSNRIVQAFYPEMFQTLGYPMRVKRTDQLWRYIDVMHETRTHFNMEMLLKGLTEEEFELYRRIVEIVDRYASDRFGIRAHPTPALLRAIHALRLIKIVTADARPTVLEVGPGCGYLAMLLVIEGYPYIGTDVAQAFYLYQNHMLSQVAANVVELAVKDDDILTVAQPKPGTAVHIPWWKWITLWPERIKVGAGIMTCNHALCEMHPHSMAYLAVVGRRMLANFPGGGKFIFENWGYDLLHSHETVAQKFAEYGLRVCHDEYAVTAMVLAEEIERWSSTRRRPAAGPPSTIWDSLPPVKPIVDEAVKGFPLSQQLTEGLATTIARAKIREDDLEEFLDRFFDGKIPRLDDEIFLDIIGTRF